MRKLMLRSARDNKCVLQLQKRSRLLTQSNQRLKVTSKSACDRCKGFGQPWPSSSPANAPMEEPSICHLPASLSVRVVIQVTTICSCLTWTSLAVVTSSMQKTHLMSRPSLKAQLDSKAPWPRFHWPRSVLSAAWIGRAWRPRSKPFSSSSSRQVEVESIAS